MHEVWKKNGTGFCLIQLDNMCRKAKEWWTAPKWYVGTQDIKKDCAIGMTLEMADVKKTVPTWTVQMG